MRTAINGVATLLTALALASASAVAVAGRPLQSEDAGVLDQAECEFEAAWGHESGGDASKSRTAAAQVGCGIGAQTQLALGLARSRSGDSRGDGVALTGKTFLRPLTDTDAGWVLAYALSAARASGQSFRHDASEIKAVISVPLPLDNWLAHGNLGWTRSETERQNSTIWSAAVERTGLGRFDLMAEFFGDDRSAPWWNTGVRYTAIDKKLFVDASYGAGMSGARPKRLTIGLKYAF